jgi:hypothetical protein
MNAVLTINCPTGECLLRQSNYIGLKYRYYRYSLDHKIMSPEVVAHATGKGGQEISDFRQILSKSSISILSEIRGYCHYLL